MNIRFRAWDKSEKKMLYPKDIFNHGNTFYEDDNEGNLHLNKILNRDGDREEFVLMMSTGTFDKNKTEIYKGDVVEYRFPNGSTMKGIVSWIAGMFVLDFSDQTDSGPIGFLQIADMEVKGNIYEN